MRQHCVTENERLAKFSTRFCLELSLQFAQIRVFVLTTRSYEERTREFTRIEILELDNVLSKTSLIARFLLRCTIVQLYANQKTEERYEKRGPGWDST